jgi:photosystem II stability/assembly factor-like uncharacterized protein
VKTYFKVCFALISSPAWAAWEALGPFGGSAAIIEVDSQNRGTLLAATSNAQLFGSQDDGDSWNPLPFPAELRATLHALVIDRHAPGVILVGLSSDTSEFSGLFRTTDGGMTWRRMPGPNLKEVWSIAVWPRDSNVIAAGTLDGVFITRDGGKTWENASARDNTGPRPVVSLQFDPLDSNILYAGTPHLAWKTVDGGKTWHSIYDGMLDDSDVFSILIHNRSRQMLFAAACGGIYRSVNSGQTWTKLKEAKGASYRTYQIAQHPLRPDILLAATAHGLVKSVDGGDTWRRLSVQATRWVAFDVFRPERIFLATDDAGLFRSDDLGESLQPVNRGFTNRRLNSIAASGNALYVGLRDAAGGAILRRADPDQMWEALPTEQLVQSSAPKVRAGDGGLLYLITNDGLAVSSSKGREWTAIPLPSRESRLIDLLFANSSGSMLLVDAEDGIYRTDDAGKTWDVVRHSRYPFRIYKAVMAYNNALLAATSRGLMRSDDRGLTWTPVPGALRDSTVTAICRHPKQPGLLFASRYGTIFASKDNGRSWAPMEQSGNAVSGLAVLPGNPDLLVVLTEARGVYAIRLGSQW